MLTPREEALLHARSVRELQTEVLMLETELKDCHVPKRAHWIEVRLSNIRQIILEKLQA